MKYYIIPFVLTFFATYVQAQSITVHPGSCGQVSITKNSTVKNKQVASSLVSHYCSLKKITANFIIVSSASVEDTFLINYKTRYYMHGKRLNLKPNIKDGQDITVGTLNDSSSDVWIDIPINLSDENLIPKQEEKLFTGQK